MLNINDIAGAGALSSGVPRAETRDQGLQFRDFLGDFRAQIAAPGLGNQQIILYPDAYPFRIFPPLQGHGEMSVKPRFVGNLPARLQGMVLVNAMGIPVMLLLAHQMGYAVRLDYVTTHGLAAPGI